MSNNKKVVVVVLIVVLLLLVGGMIAGFVVWKKKEDEAAQAIKDDEREEDRENDDDKSPVPPPPPPPPTGDDPGGSPDDGSGTDGLGDGRSCITYEGQELCCPTGYDTYGDGSACVDGTDRCALYGNASLPRCPGGVTSTDPLDQPGYCFRTAAYVGLIGQLTPRDGRACVADCRVPTGLYGATISGAKPVCGQWFPQSGRCVWEGSSIIWPYHSKDECDAANVKSINEGKEPMFQWIED